MVSRRNPDKSQVEKRSPGSPAGDSRRLPLRSRADSISKKKKKMKKRERSMRRSFREMGLRVTTDL